MLHALVEKKAKSVKAASAVLSVLSAEKKNRLLETIGEQLLRNSGEILKANARDLRWARRAGLSKVLLDRLTLDEKRIAQMRAGIRDIVALPDPVGKVLSTVERPNGLRIEKVSVPIGAVGIIYEARPNVTIDASALCL